VRLVELRAEMLLTGPIFGVAGVASIGLGLAYWPDDTAPLWALTVFTAFFALLSLFTWRDVRRAEPLAIESVVVESPYRGLMSVVPFAVISVLTAAAIGEGDLGAILLGGSIGQLACFAFLTRFERRARRRVLRVKGFNSKPRLVLGPELPLKDTATAHRISAHAQPEAPRRAP
jgi:hypothetical protein